MARRRSSLAYHGSPGWDRVAIHGPARWPARHFVFACAAAPSDADVATRLADQAVPLRASRSPGSVFRPVTSKSAPHRVDHVFVCGVPLHESWRRPRPGIRFLILPAGSETTALVRWLRSLPAPRVVAEHKIPALGCLHASASDSRFLRLECRASPASADEHVDHIL